MAQGDERVMALEATEVEQVAAGVGVGVKEKRGRRLGGGHGGKKAQKRRKWKRSCADGAAC